MLAFFFKLGYEMGKLKKSPKQAYLGDSWEIVATRFELATSASRTLKAYVLS
jgi:hypothetical protein